MFISARNISFLLLSISTFSVLCVQAADIPLRGPIPFEAFDKDSNKMISPQEFVETHNLRKKMRTDVNMPSGRGSRSFTFFDTNGDNQISKDELDMNRGAMWQNNPQGQGMRPGMGRGMGPGMGRGMGPGMNRGRQMPDFADIDLNGDGALQREELLKAREERMRRRAEQGYMMRNAANAPTFTAIDANHDGKVTEEEFAAHQAMRRQMRGRPR